ncbi:MAG: hypothetical protein F6K09_27455 [Merismopedia sp. SIO2A8]|nr:hypothetical protein [Merismopedia sp. SIO2A8]
MQASITLSQPWHPLLKVLGKSLAGLALATSIVGYGISGLPSLNNTSSHAAIASTISRQAQQSLQPSLPSLTPTAAPLTTAPSTIHSSKQSSSVDHVESAFKSVPTSNMQPLGNGTYVYGQSPDPDTVGSVYMVFNVNDRDVVGAFYMPHSSFDCFRGSFEANELALTIRDSYEQTTFSHSVALVPSEDAIASTNIATITGLEGFYQLDTFTETDQHVLSTCRSEAW